MTTLIAGATGLIGRRIVQKLIEAQHEVVVLTRKPATLIAPGSSSIRFVRWDARTPGDWCRDLNRADAVINLTGESIGARRWTAAQKDRILTSRINATKAIVDAIGASSSKPQVLVNASGVDYYGETGDVDVLESHPSGSSFLADVCLQWESAARAAERLGVRVVLPRSAVVLDAHAAALKKLALPFRLFFGGPPGTGNQWFPWIHLEDEAEAILFAIENSALSGPVNLVAPQPVTMREFCSALGSALKRPSWAPVPPFLLKLALGEMSDLVLMGRRAIPGRLLDAGYRFKFSRLDEALADVFGKKK
jgi:uncharacterized protein (TIGR01777 family)